MMLFGSMALLGARKGGKNDKTNKETERTPLIEGAWCWFADPRALCYNGNVYAGAVNTAGSALVASWPDCGGMDTSFVLHAVLHQDDHANPTLLVRDSDARLLTFYSQHDGTTMYMRISTNPEDVSAWGAETGLDASLGGNRYTYPIPIQLTGEENDPIYLFYRDRDAPGGPGDDADWSYSKSVDGGATWAARTNFYSNGENGPYIKAVANGTARIDFCATDGHPRTINASIYHFYYQGGNFYETDGTLIGAGPLAPADLTQVYDGSVTNSWIWDIALDGSGYPVIVYATFADINDHLYRYARWDGNDWNNYSVVAGGDTIYEAAGTEDHYSGGIVLDHSDVNTVYLSRQVNSVHEIWKYTTSDGGLNWTGTAFTSGNNTDNKQIRPFVIRNHGSDTLLWMAGKYTTYANYKTDIVRY